MVNYSVFYSVKIRQMVTYNVFYVAKLAQWFFIVCSTVLN
jgi:hypothetical protein